jgi:hypothetical protein
MNAQTSVFRGYNGIKEIKTMIEPMIEWLLKYKPEPQHLKLHRKDYDLLVRWPKAGAMHGFEVSAEGIVTFKRVILGYDKRPGRYSQSAKEGK